MSDHSRRLEIIRLAKEEFKAMSPERQAELTRGFERATEEARRIVDRGARLWDTYYRMNPKEG